jgi:hypothetical protein
MVIFFLNGQLLDVILLQTKSDVGQQAALTARQRLEQD